MLLVDTGAQANLVRRGVLPERLFAPAERPLSLSTACGQAMDGGQREVQLQKGMRKEDLNDEDGGIWWGEGFFHDADITVDAIVGWPWLKPKGIVVVTAHNCLARLPGSRELRLMWPWTQKADRDTDYKEDKTIDNRPVFTAASRPQRTARIAHHAVKAPRTWTEWARNAQCGAPTPICGRKRGRTRSGSRCRSKRWSHRTASRQRWRTPTAATVSGRRPPHASSGPKERWHGSAT